MDIITVILLVVLLVIALSFILRTKIIGALAWGLKIFFVLLIALALSALFLPQVYTGAADFSLKQLGTYTTIQTLDKNIGDVTNAPQNLLDGLLNWLNPQPKPQTNNKSTGPGPLEQQLYPQLVSTITIIYRILAITMAIIGLLVIVYLGYSIGSATDVAKLTREYKLLTERVRELENKLGVGAQNLEPVPETPSVYH